MAEASSPEAPRCRRTNESAGENGSRASGMMGRPARYAESVVRRKWAHYAAKKKPAFEKAGSGETISDA